MIHWVANEKWYNNKKKRFSQIKLLLGKANPFMKVFLRWPKRPFLSGPLHKFDDTNNSMQWHTHIVKLEIEELGFCWFIVVKTLPNIRDRNSQRLTVFS